MLRFGREITGELEAVMRREWLVTNGIGGFAMGTPAGARTRRYHGLLVAALEPPAHRTLLVAALDAWVEIDGLKHPLCTHEWAAGVLLPDGYRHLEAFRLDGNVPTWIWTLGDLCIEQRLWMQPGKNTTYITYESVRGSQPIVLQLIPLCSYRDYHRDTKGGQAILTDLMDSGGVYRATIQVPEDLSRDPGAPVPRPFRVQCTADSAAATAEWWWSFHLAQETERGLVDHEDLFAAVTFRKKLNPGDSMVMLCTAEEEPSPAWQMSLAEIREREVDLLRGARLDAAPAWVQRLALAADQFVVDRPIGNGSGKSILAGYPWFTDWGRDTMVALPGLTLAVHRPEIAASVLRTYAHFVNQGMLPNRFPDQAQAPEYNTADATLWYFEALRAYLAYQDDPDLSKFLYPVLREIIDWHVRGTRYNIHVDPADGLLYAGEAGSQLTWMDVKIEDWVVTPRVGKPVEINALWYNALCVMVDLASRLGKTEDASRFDEMAQQAQASFAARFWYSGGYLYDVIDMPDGEDDASLRPNQLIALSLPVSLLDDEKARSIVDVCARELVTSFGLRTLAPDETDYIGHYGGDTRTRDSAYHQGTAWSWLMGPFVAAHFKVYKDAKAAYSYLEPFGDHLADAGLGTISEIFDGDPPHTPRGCVAQAWGVAEALRAYRLIESALREAQS